MVVVGLRAAVMLAVLVVHTVVVAVPTASNCMGKGIWSSASQFQDTRSVYVTPNNTRANGTCVCSDPAHIGPECANVQCPNNCGHTATNPKGECIQGVCYCYEVGNAGVVQHRKGSGCELQPCIADCNGNGKCVSGQCQCYDGYRGLSCAEKTPNCNHGTETGGMCSCDSGWTGAKCNLKTCENNCHANHGHGMCFNGTCGCNPGYVGDSCELIICPNFCSRRGSCDKSTGKCNCQAGYTGNDCSQQTCPVSCGVHGTCKGTSCVCDEGYAGTGCNMPACTKNCSGNGVCRSRRCYCKKGYTGAICDVSTCPFNCSGNGICDEGTDKCVCHPGWMGFACELKQCHSGEDHAEGMCSGNGYCEDDGKCSCRPGWGGEKCNVRRCPNACSGVGVCKDGYCVCPSGRGGNDCGMRVCPKNCSSRGKCITAPSAADIASAAAQNSSLEDDWTGPYCECPYPYIGEACEKETCPSNCTNHGFCFEGSCYCESGWGGHQCELKLCDCNGHGTCPEGSAKCYCDPGWDGPSCGMMSCPNDCSGNGVCNPFGICDCFVNASGANCSSHCPSEDDDAYDNEGLLCSGNGVCKNETGECMCEPGWGGAKCERQTCGACSNHGYCDNGTCHCTSEWQGIDCSDPVPLGEASPACACSVECTHKCLDTCRGIAETRNIQDGHNCFLNCQQVCRTNCALKGSPVIQGFSNKWSEAEYFKTHVLPEPVLRETVKEKENDGMMQLVQTRATLRPNSAPRPSLAVFELNHPHPVARNVEIATLDE